MVTSNFKFFMLYWWETGMKPQPGTYPSYVHGCIWLHGYLGREQRMLQLNHSSQEHRPGKHSTVIKITCPAYQAYIFLFKMQNRLPTHCCNIHKRSHFPQQDTVRHKQTLLPPKHPLSSGQTKPNFSLHARAASPTSEQLWSMEQDSQTRVCLLSCERERKLKLAEMTSIQRKPRTAQPLPNYRMLLTHSPVEVPCIPTNRHSPSFMQLPSAFKW